MTNTIKGMAITARTLNSLRTGSDDELENGVNIPIIQTMANKAEYNKTFKTLQTMVDGYQASTKNLDLQAIAQDRHNINNYDGHYDYYIASYIKDKTGEFKMVRIPTTLNEDEEAMVQRILWSNRGVNKTVRSQAKQILSNAYTNDFKLFANDIENNTYKSVWHTENSEAFVVLTISGIYSGNYDIKVQAFGNINSRTQAQTEQTPDE